MNSICFTSLQKSFSNLLRPGGNIKQTVTLQPVAQTVIPSRNTYILKRRWPVKLAKIGAVSRKLKAKDYVYEHVKFEDVEKKPDVTVILREYVEGIGRKGEAVTVSRNFAYNNLLVPGLADYATPEAIEKSILSQKDGSENEYSSMTAPLVVNYLEGMQLSVAMSKDNDWTLEPWHIRVAFRKAGIHVPEECIQLPSRQISGPNLNAENKTFFVTVTINNREKATVRCSLHHFTPNLSERMPYVANPWALPPVAMFPEDEEKVSQLPVIKFKSI